MTNAHQQTPSDLKAWIQTQVTLSVGTALAELQAEIHQVDGWANGIFAALQDVAFYLALRDQELARTLRQSWRTAAERFAAIEMGAVIEDEAESLEILEARKMLHGLFEVAKIGAQARR